MAVNGRDEEAGVERSESVVVDDEESCVGEIIDGVCVDGRGGGVGCGGGEKVGVDVGNGECFAQHGDCRKVRLRASRQAANDAAADGVTRSSAAAAHLARFVVGSRSGASNVGTGGGSDQDESFGESHTASGEVDDAKVLPGSNSCVVVGEMAGADVGVCELGGGVWGAGLLGGVSAVTEEPYSCRMFWMLGVLMRLHLSGVRVSRKRLVCVCETPASSARR